MSLAASTHIERILSSVITGIDKGQLKTGKRLSSIRAAALEYGVSKNTVAEAYDRLVALGYVEGRPGSGYYVAPTRRPAARALPGHVTEAIDLVSLLREQLHQHYAVRVGDGRPPAAWTDGSELGKHLRNMGTRAGHDIAYGYGDPLGYPPLRELIAMSLAERAIQCSAEQVLMTQGANHALDLVVRHYVAPGDAVLVDSPGYYPLFGKLALAQARLVGVRRTPDGPDLEDLAARAAASRAKLFFTQSLAHNPTGGSLSLGTAHRVLQIAARHDLTIIEDDPFADVLPAASPRLAALDQLERVIYVGSLSKTLSASLRVGYLAASAERVQALTDLKMVTCISTSDHTERGLYHLFAGGHYRRHLQRLKQRIERARVKAVGHLERMGARLFCTDTGGYYLWLELPESLDEHALVREAAEHGIFLAAGSVFLPQRQAAPPTLRVNIAYADDSRFLDFMRRKLAGASY